MPFSVWQEELLEICSPKHNFLCQWRSTLLLPSLDVSVLCPHTQTLCLQWCSRNWTYRWRLHQLLHKLAVDLLCPPHLVGRNVGSHHLSRARNIPPRPVAQKSHQAQKRHGQPGLASTDREHEQVGVSDRRMELCQTVPASFSRSDVPESVYPLGHSSGHPLFCSSG